MIKYAALLEANFRKIKLKTTGSWRRDETYIKVKGKWIYYYRAVDKYGAIIDFYLNKTRNEQEDARAFFDKVIQSSGLPSKVAIDKSEANVATLDTINIWADTCAYDRNICG